MNAASSPKAWRQPLAWVLAVGACTLLGSCSHLLEGYGALVLMLVGINIILAVSLNLVNGFMGEFSVGHAGFMATGAYVSSLLTVHSLPQAWWAFPLALLCGGLGAGLMGLLVSIPSFRTRGDYLAIVTLAFNMIVKSVIENLDVVGGPRGFLGMDRLTTVPWVFGCVVVSLWAVRNLVDSRYGRGILAVREDELAAEMTGVDTRRVKALAFSLSAALCGVAGALSAHLLQFISPGSFDIVKSTEILLMVYLGGVGSITGSVLGATLYTVLLELLRPLETWRMAVMPLLLVLLVIFRPKGVLGTFELPWLAWNRRPEEQPPQPGALEASPGPNPPGTAGVSCVFPDPAASPLLELRAVSHAFGGLKALTGIHLTLAAGEVGGVIGPNGAGKTTLFNLISGVYQPQEGQILLCGKAIAGRRPSAIAAMGLARTFQNIRLYRELSVLDNLRAAQYLGMEVSPVSALFHLGRHGEEERQVLRKSRELLAGLDLEAYAQEKASNLPYGLQRRLEILRSVATQPRLLLLDEPAAGMLPGEVDALMTFILRLKERHALTILLIEHQMRLVMGLCDAITVLDFGQVIAQGDPAHIQGHAGVQQAYMGAGRSA